MRRLSLGVTAALLAAFAFAFPVAAAPPDRSPVEPAPPLELDAGAVCDFAIVLSTPSDSGTVRFWDLGQGGARLLQSGKAVIRATNPSSGEWFDHPGGYRLRLDFAADGSLEVDVTGSFFAFYFAGDPVVGLTQGLYAVHGHLHESYAPDGSLMGARFYGGHVVDLCALLAG